MKGIFTICLILLTSTLVFAQSPNPTPQRTPTRGENDRQRQIEREQQRQQRDIPFEDLRKVTNTSLSAKAILLSSAVKLERSPEQSQRLVPNAQDLIKYETFLKSKNTGLFKLFPDFGCDSKNLVKIDDNCENSIPFTWSYSFLRKDYGDKDFFDIRLKNERIVGDSFLAQNVLVSLGDVAIENVTLKTNGIKFLLDFKPEVQEKRIQQQFWQIAKKIENEGFSYAKVIIPQENTTYSIRIVSYRISNGNTLEIEKNGPRSEEERRLLQASNDKTRRDKIIVFRIIRKDSDGSFTILWKELIDKRSPELKFERVEQLTGDEK